MRLDKYLALAGYGSRKEIKQFIRNGYVEVNGEIIKKDDFKIDENNDSVTFDGELVEYMEHVYIMMNKPAGCVCANDDRKAETVFEYVPEYSHRDLFTVGRLDIDTTGLLLITDDGDFAHHIISPKNMIPKVYQCDLISPINDEQIKQLETGIDFKDFSSMPAKVEVVDSKRILLTIFEGKFHQVKRMLIAVGNEVVNLKRLSIGDVTLDEELIEGGYRLLTTDEYDKLIKK
ncbi:MAG: rRNA pseudouridine synthase [Erysipelotrichales bacterium]|nr:rRNA pseudouridine synthase [Erysipelotrichales bacterium]